MSIRTKGRLTQSEKNKLTDIEKLVWLYRQVPVLAAKELLGIELTWFQRVMLNAMFFKNYVLLLLGRGIGKTWLDAVFAILYAMLYPGTKIGIIAPVFRQAGYIFDFIDEIYESSPYFRASVRKYGKNKGIQRTMSREIVRFKNRSFIEALPLGDGNKIRGRRYNVVICDEYAQINEDIIKLVVRPMMAIRKKDIANKMIISSTAFYAWNHLYLQYLMYRVMEKRKPDQYQVFEFNYHDLIALGADAPYLIDEDALRMQKADMTEEAFSMEHEAKFPVETKGFFPARLIESVCSYHDDATQIHMEAFEGQYVMGVDAARIAGGDNFAINVIKIGDGMNRAPVYAKTMNGATFQQMLATLRMTLHRFPIIRIMMDPAGGGTTFKDLLAEPWTHPITKETVLPIYDMDDKDIPEDAIGIRSLRMINFTQPSINHMYTGLKADMQHKRFQFPVDIKRHIDKELERCGHDMIMTKQELMLLEAEPTGNYFKFVVPEGKRKDRATALALANMGVNELLTVPEIAETELAFGGWV